MKPDRDQIVTCEIERLGSQGEGIGHLDGYTLFVDGALPGETVEARITISKKNYARADIVKRLNASALRTTPPCPVFAQCGGCQLQHMTYEGQLDAKRQRVEDAMRRIGGFTETPVAACIPSPSDWHYRNKMQLPVVGKPGQLQIGLYAKGSNDLVEIPGCMIHCEHGDRVFHQIKAALEASSIAPYCRKTGKGELRHVLIKSAVKSAQVLVVLICNGAPSKELCEIAEALMQENAQIKGVVANINRRRDNVILGKDYQTLCGDDVIYDELCGLNFKISPASFFQVNPPQAENLYRQVIEWAMLTGSEQVIDAYCGVGTMSLLVAERCQAVLGIEWVPEAIADAQENAARNQIHNAQFVCGDAAEKLRRQKQADVLILNPPRKGCEPEMIEATLALGPDRILYVSCDPATLARDLKLLCADGYRVAEVQPFDMFPQTVHVETVVKLERTRG